MVPALGMLTEFPKKVYVPAVLINLKPYITSLDSISVVVKNESEAVEGVITSYSDRKPLF